MPHDRDIDDPTELARAEFRDAMMSTFCAPLQKTRLPPMTVLAPAAEAAGSIYRAVADAHRDDDVCPCGWKPAPEADPQSLQVALALTADPAPVFDLRRTLAIEHA